ncbi:hypothetical protein CS0771_25010 [Catellatospora sp. IY07-71]|uniref:hypothetical protein n=1 Tax=Catellatospora sp. IY07-71 TaxID=2728827 RepID=UPI001BB33E97|nr:hypothetical protein [Catellatospora sp. IY07-71]BCJ72957.1 hypothetical protein CS0771_25010 [Catellatospora sp. IY07-71]
MIETLRTTLDRHAERVTPRPDPYARVLRRSRRRRQQRTSALALVALLLVVAPVAWFATRPGPALPVLGEPPATLQPLLDSPTRGDLSGDAAFLDALRRRTVDQIHGDRGDPQQGLWMPDDPDQVKVLFAGDVGTRRVGVVAGLTSRPLLAWFSGEAGAAVPELESQGYGELAPVVELGIHIDSPETTMAFLLLGPTGAGYEQATTTYSAAGVRQVWEPIDIGSADYLGLPDLRGTHDFRVVVDGRVLLQTMGGYVAPTSADRQPAVDPQPVADRGRPFPDLARQLATALAETTGLTGPGVTFRVLWSDELDIPGTSTGRAYVATVQAVLADGGGPYLTYAFDVGDQTFRDHPTGYGVAGGPEHALIVMRLPSYAAEPNSRVQIVAPPGAVRAVVTTGTGTQQVTLVNGVGHLDLASGAGADVRAYDATGALLAEKQYVDRDGFACNRFDPSVCTSPPPVVQNRP